MPVITNSLGSTKVTTLDVGSNGQYTNTNLTANAIREVVTAQGVSHIRWTGDWQISQGSNVVFRSATATSGDWDLSTQGLILYGSNRTASIQANTTTSNSTLIMTITKTVVSNTV
jgi:hypothetical protein